MQSLGVVCATTLSLLVLIGLTSNSLPLELNKVSGTLISAPGVALPEGAIAYITLLDVSPRQDVESSIIARQTITDPDQLPIAFEVLYNPNQIRSDHLYAIQAQVTTEGRVVLRNCSAYPVITQGNPFVIEVLVDLVE
nr:YbaY family lipoprotein [Oculatella sp. FACHB-28]